MTKRSQEEWSQDREAEALRQADVSRGDADFMGGSGKGGGKERPVKQSGVMAESLEETAGRRLPTKIGVSLARANVLASRPSREETRETRRVRARWDFTVGGRLRLFSLLCTI